jgi:hypothetical protein
MSQQVTITSVTANTPVEIYYCNSFSASCVYEATVSVFPYTFQVPEPYDYQDIVIKIVDTQGCEIGEFIYITPTPTPTITASPTVTPTYTPTNTMTNTVTPTKTPTNTTTNTLTPTNTPSPTTTPVIASHLIGQKLTASSASTCTDIMTITSYYTYIADANLTPVIGATVYQTQVGGTLYNPVYGDNRWIRMVFGSYYYAVQINGTGQIVNYQLCP